MYSISDIGKDTIIELGGDPYRVLEYAHSKQARGGSLAKLKIRNLRTGSIQTKTLKGNHKVAPADVIQKDVQFLYRDGVNLIIMDLGTYEQTQVNADVAGEAAKFLKAGAQVTALFFGSSIIGLELPKHVTAIVARTEPGVRGDTVSSTLKPATLEGGATVQVPLFINTGDKIKVDTRTGQYLGRA